MMRDLTRDEIDELLGSQAVGRIGCHAGGSTYVVPVIYALADGCAYVASLEGRKIRMMRENPDVCFEVDEYDGAGSWRSAIAQGVYEELGPAEAEEALAILAERFPGAGGERAQRSRAGDGPPMVCFRIRLREVTGRAAER
ncbi:MAG TPA: pyridoxamine 5'-phosphate oxidase family protein [Gaiellaceae bacterium]|nr:pyridoxamine 5'-phosphate oxidase family protein [Gaiellaceae bacterium]